MNTKTVKAYSVKIYLAGDYADAVRACRRFVMTGLCVTVEKADYVYTGGLEAGVVIGLVNYPRFPAKPEAIISQAKGLAAYLMSELCQTSAMVCDGILTQWITTRDCESDSEYWLAEAKEEARAGLYSDAIKTCMDKLSMSREEAETFVEMEK